jgi:RNA polymerase sigma factor for flagellar operon FliA
MSDDLATFAVTRDLALRDALAVRHLPLVKFVARKMSANLPNNVELDDLVSWGSLGLLDAIDKFDPGRKVQFSTYAVTRIRGAILDGLQQMEWAPKQVTSKVRAVRRVVDALGHELNREPTPEEIAARMDCTSAEVRGWLLDYNVQRVKPLDTPASGEGEQHDYSRELAEDDEQKIAGEVAEIRARVTCAVAGLEDKEAAVFLLYYRDGLTLREIASELGVSVSSATQTHTRLVEHVRERLAAFGAVA